MIGIYKITNLIDEKCYIGKSTNIDNRFKQYRSLREDRTNQHLYRAFLKYGLDNFSFEIIEECSKAELNDREIYWINYYKSINSDGMYNIAAGGAGGDTITGLSDEAYDNYIKKISKPRTEEFRKSQSERFSGENNPMYGKTGSLTQKKAVSNRVKGTKWINNGVEQTFVKPEELNHYLLNGWQLGMLKK